MLCTPISTDHFTSPPENLPTAGGFLLWGAAHRYAGGLRGGAEGRGLPSWLGP